MKIVFVCCLLVGMSWAASLDAKETMLLKELNELLNNVDGEAQAKYVPASMMIDMTSTSITFTVIKDKNEDTEGRYAILYKLQNAQEWQTNNAPGTYDTVFTGGRCTISGLTPGSTYQVTEEFNGAQRGSIVTVTLPSSAKARYQLKVTDV